MKEEKLKTIQMDITKLIPYVRNPRKNDAVVNKMAASIKEFGFKIPIVAQSDGTVIDGHLRLKAAMLLGLKTLPVVIADDLTDTQVKAFRLLANQSANWAEWDMDLLKLELEELKNDNFDIDLIGFDDGFLNEFESTIDTDSDLNSQENENDAPELDGEQSICQPGEIWICGNHKLVCGDSTDAALVAKLMDGEKATLGFTDPPYGVSIGDKNLWLLKERKPKVSKSITKNIKNDTLNSQELHKLIVAALSNMRDNCTESASFYVTLPLYEENFAAMREAGMPVRHVLIWLKNTATFTMGRLDYEHRTEPILYAWAKRHNFYGHGYHKDNVWSIQREKVCDLHPTMKPVELVRNCILNSSLQNDIVMDVFGGSGTTMIACEETNRKARLIELDPHYCDVIIKRWQTFTKCEAVRQSDGLIFNAN